MVSTAGFPYHHSIAKKYRIMWSFFPPNLLAEALKLLLHAVSKTEDVGIRWSKRADCPPNKNKCVMTIVSTQFKAQTFNIDSYHHSFSFMFFVLFSLFTFLFSFSNEKLNFHNLPCIFSYSFRMVSISGLHPHFSCGLFWLSTLIT